MNSKPLLILKASAGSGKTYTLVEEFLKIILNEKNDAYYKSVLALTFTNKAAKEMKERIIDALEVLAKDPSEIGFDAKFLGDKVESLGLSPENIRDKSRGCLNEIIHNYGNLSIMTIDKFSHKIVRAFARDLELESDFGIELDSTELKKEVIAELIDSYGKDKKLSNILFKYSQANIEEGSVWNVSKNLLDFSKTIDNEKYEIEVDKLTELTDEDFDRIQKELTTQLESIKSSYEALINDFLKYLESLSTDFDDYSYKSGGIYGNVLKKSRILLNDLDSILSNGNLRKCHEKDDFSRKEGLNKEVVQSGTTKIKEFIDLHDNFYDGQYAKYTTLEGIRKKFYNIRLINNIKKTVDKIKEDKNIKELSDLNKEISKIILSESIPFIYERIGERYKHFLLDEFQDTSVMQWQNLIPLVENGMAELKKSLIVGDAKQSIYRFRNGEVEQFINLPDLYNPRESEVIESKRTYFKQMSEKDSLESNYRSKKEIVTFNNELFEKFSAYIPENYKSIYTEDFKQKAVKGEGGYVRVEIKEDFEEEEKIQSVVETIKSCLDSGYQKKDICIIQRRKSEGIALAELLELNEINVISDDSLFVRNDLTVQFLVAALDLVNDPLSYEVQSFFAEKYLQILSEDTSKVISYQYKEEKKNRFQLKVFFEDFELTNLEDLRKYDSLVELIYQLKNAFKLNYEENPYLELFFEQVYKYEIKHSAYLKGFLEWWKEKGESESISIPDTTNAVKMMTVHKSKGLQFPVVIVPYCEWGYGDIGVSGKKDTIWVSQENGVLDTYCVDTKNPESELNDTLKQVFQHEKHQMMLDEVNNLYVAFTRAVDRLYVLGNLKYSGKGKDRDLSPTRISTPLFRSLGEESVFESGEERPSSQKNTEVRNELGLRTDLEKNESVAFSFKPIYPNESIQYNIDYGVHLHDVLSKILKPEDLKELETKVAKLNISKEEQTKIIEDIRSLVANKEIASLLFDDVAECISEQDIITETGKILRPDRVLLKKDRVVVIDFKTGEPRSKDKKQVKEYVSVLKQFGAGVVEGVLVYTSKREILKC
jgi:ATP-dependent exoDNAse (exonuclease V) beta subunit